MNESALTLRDERKATTSRRLKEAARALTAERGLSGFTIEELCSEVGVSRRTFFNYFASKENAVIGIPIDSDREAIEQAFVEAGPTGLDSILDYLLELQMARWATVDLTHDDVRDLFQAFEREPKLLQVALRLAGEGERDDIALVERREALPAGDVRAATAVQFFGALLRASVEEMFRAHEDSSPDDLRALLRRRLEVARQLLA
ncbi:TetR/AcrR family transcriptional regulator [Humibacter sp. BT305]|nr:TetR/AcrR family transcriptional regulator [Humibacter sp. BT305]